MSSTSKPSPLAEESQWSTEPPTKPGTYWFQQEPTSRMVMLEVRERGNIRGDPQGGELTVTGNWSAPDEPVAKLKGHWRGPIPPSSGPGTG